MGLSKSVILVSNVNEEELVKIAKEIEILSKNALSQERKTNLIEVKRHEVGIHIENNCGIMVVSSKLVEDILL
jgi:AMMECR1 domain-containing protein